MRTAGASDRRQRRMDGCHCVIWEGRQATIEGAFEKIGGRLLEGVQMRANKKGERQSKHLGYG